MIGEGGVQLLADDAADEIAKCRREILTGSVGAVYGRTGAFSCATRAGKLAPAPADVPDSKDGSVLRSRPASSAPAVRSVLAFRPPAPFMSSATAAARVVMGTGATERLRSPALLYVHRSLQLSRA